MKLTHEVLSEAPSFISPIGTRTLSLRSLNLTSLDAIHVLETSDIHSTIDLSSNNISLLTPFPKLWRLTILLLANNHIQTIFGLKGLNNLEVLSLSFNEILYLSDLEELKDLPNLRSLYINGNPIVKNKNYRLWCIWRFPHLQTLDFQRVKDSERILAEETFKDKNLVKSILSIGTRKVLGSETELVKKKHGLGDADRHKLEEELVNAESLEEIQRLEEILNKGHF